MKRLPEDHPCYDDNIGVSKAAVVKNLKERGFRVVFVGDGPPDILPAAGSRCGLCQKAPAGPLPP